MAIVFGGASAAPAVAQQTYSYPRLPLNEALQSLSREARLAIDFGDIDVANLESGLVRAATSPEDALRAMLRGTGVTFTFVGPRAVKLQAPQPAPERPFRHRKPPPAAELRILEPVIVTAPKRVVDQLGFPASISVEDGEELETARARGFDDLIARTPSVSATNLGPSRNKIFIRGISDGAFADRTQSTVGVYLDEIQVIFTDTNPDVRIVDLERIEILRGPQSTLYGSGNIGGVVRYISAKPDVDGQSLRASARVSTTDEGGENVSVDLAANTPVVEDRFALRVAGFYDAESGYIDN
ncbi:MAG: TonB-dependent receptor plug domain-containing protein, partial [Pseudomonadota bacterium]